MPGFKVLSLAVATGRVGHVFFVDGRLAHWSLSANASRSPALAAKQVDKWIAKFQPDVVVNEKLSVSSRKGKQTKSLIAAMVQTASGAKVNDIVVPRVQAYENKYQEAAALAERFLIIAPWLPKRPRIWESEPRNMILFEALALALPVIDPPSSTA